MTRSHRSRVPVVTGVVLVLAALALGGGGLWLFQLGGSPYYAAAAAALALTGLLLMRRSPGALWLHALLFIASLAWALWEVGLDWWPLAARQGVLFLIGLWLLMPWLTRGLGRVDATLDAEHGLRPAAGSSWRRGGGLLLSLALLAFVGVAVASWLRDPHETAGQFAESPAAAVAAAGESGAAEGPPGEWPAYGRTGHGQRFSPLTQLTPDNVAGLAVAWQFRTGDVRGRPGDPEETTFEVTPLKIGNRLFLCTPHQAVIALDATTGAEIWRYTPQVQDGLALQHLTCRGLGYQPANSAAASASPGPAASPALASASSPTPTPTPPPTPTPTPTPTPSPAAAASAADAPVAASSAPAVAAVAPAASSPRAGLPVATARGNVAAECPAKLFMPTADGRLIALDPETGAVCAGFGGGTGQIDLWAHMPNVTPGAYYATSPPVVTSRLVIVGGTVLDNASVREQSGVIRAFDVNTGALVWAWDAGRPDSATPLPPGQTYTPNSPNSWSISSVDEALGMVYVPMGNQPPDQWGGQRSAAVEKYASSVVALDLATGRVRWVFQTVRHDLWDYDVPSQPSLVDLQIDGRSVPALVQPTKQGELFVLDRRSGQPLLPVNEVPAPQGAAAGDRTAPTQPRSALSFEPPPLTERSMWGATMFDQLACRIAFHRLRYEGRFTPPSTQGSLIYPGNFGVFNWGSIAVDPRRQVAFTTPTYLAFVSKLVPRPDDTTLMVQEKGPPKGSLPALNENFGAPFAASMKPFVSPLGIPCQAPPWGYVAGADLRTGQVVWQRRNGTVRDLSPLPLPFKMGVPNLGGPVLTASGVAFLSGSMDDYVRAYDVRDGRTLWQARLPAGGQATPMTYTGSDGRQYLLVVAGGHGSTHTRPGDYVIAYALPK